MALSPGKLCAGSFTMSRDLQGGAIPAMPKQLEYCKSVIGRGVVDVSDNDLALGPIIIIMKGPFFAVELSRRTG